MRIAILAHAPSVHTLGWIRSIAVDGNDILLLSLASPSPGDYQGIPGLSIVDLGIEARRGKPLFHKLAYLGAVNEIRRRLRQYRADVVHAHYASSYGLLGALAGFHPYIISVWGSDVYEFPRTSPLHKMILRYNLSRADLILSTSRAMAEETKKYTSALVEVTPFGIDTEIFLPQAPNPELFPGELVIGTTKSLETVYGQEILIRAFRLLVEECPDIPLRLVLVGRGREEARLRSLTGKLGLQNKVSFVGFVHHEVIPQYHARFDIFANLSDAESFGVAVLEAQACGKPVVATRVGGLPEVVEDGVTGFLVPPRNPESAAEALVRLVKDPELRSRMGIAGRRRVERLYDRRVCNPRRLEFYRSVIESPIASRSAGWNKPDA